MIVDGKRELAYVVSIDNITPIEGADNICLAHVGGWPVIVKKIEFSIGDKAIYFEIDSKVPATDERFAFLENKGYKIKTMKLNKFKVYSQGLLMPMAEFPELGDLDKGTPLTERLGVKYAVDEDNERKSNKIDKDKKYQSMAARNPNLFKKKPVRWLMRRNWGRKLLFVFFGKKKDNPKGWPVGKFPGVSKTDQERIENMTWVLQDKTPYIRTQKCDGSSGTFILERKGRNKFEFYVCSRNVRMENEDQECFYGRDNYYWQAAKKYDIESKMKDYLNKHPELTFVCWQGEICAPGVQKNPQGLKDLHLFCFHWTDNTGRWDIRAAARAWEEYNMEVVPIDEEEYILPDDFEEFKTTADGYYDASCCEGKATQRREGYVYYSTIDPNKSFKNVSREYLMKHQN